MAGQPAFVMAKVRQAPTLVWLAANMILLAGCAPPSGASSTAPSPSQPSPVVSSDGDSALLEQEFLDHVAAVHETVIDAVSGVMSASLVGDDLDLVTANLALAVVVADEREWLTAHQPAECYRESWQQYMDILNAYSDGSMHFSEGDEDSAVEDFAAATGQFNDLVEVRPTC